jgi:hypothetical protein
VLGKSRKKTRCIPGVEKVEHVGDLTLQLFISSRVIKQPEGVQGSKTVTIGICNVYEEIVGPRELVQVGPVLSTLYHEAVTRRISFYQISCFLYVFFELHFCVYSFSPGSGMGR